MSDARGNSDRPSQLSSNPLANYEAAEDAILARGASPELHKAAVLALARSGATEFALERFNAFGLCALDSDEDALALLGRLHKDRADTLNGLPRRMALQESAGAYLRAYRLTGGIYSGINAATMSVIAGNRSAAEAIARNVFKKAHQPVAGESVEMRYYREATCTEALIITGRADDAVRALAETISVDPDNYIAHATTLRQFERLLRAMDEPLDWLDAFRPPLACFYAGRIHGIDSTGEHPDVLGFQIDQHLDNSRIGSAHGALAAGSDIIFAERILARGGQLNVVLPCDVETFARTSVIPFGETWAARYQYCLDRAISVDIATEDSSLLGRISVELAAGLAMGNAIAQAEQLSTRAIQFLIAPRHGSITQSLQAIWQHSGRGHASVTLTPDVPADTPPVMEPSWMLQKDPRQLFAMVFTDLTHFGSLSDQQVMLTVDHVLKPLSDVLKGAGSSLRLMDSWGDGIFAAFDDVSAAARTALELQSAMRRLEFDWDRLPKRLGLRIGAHFGPVNLALDPVTGRDNLYGSQVTYAARIEPLAPPGAILASQAFASALSLASPGGITATYAGRRRLKGMTDAVRLFTVKAGHLSA
tara:strand:- start:8305 stop:10077 length:1773 start_codon:yes stop_codon:yes gene_type:complete